MPYILYMIKINENLKRLRKSKGWSQVELAQMLGVSQKAITSYETGTKKPPIYRLPKLAAIFNVSMEELIGEQELTIKNHTPHLHRSSRLARMQSLYGKLPPDEQRVILKQVEVLATR